MIENALAFLMTVGGPTDCGAIEPFARSAHEIVKKAARTCLFAVRHRPVEIWACAEARSAKGRGSGLLRRGKLVLVVEALSAKEAGMDTKIEATFDGQVFRPSGPVSLPPNTTVHLIIEPIIEKPATFLQTARSLNLEGPPDWASNLDADPHGDGGGSEA